MEINNLMCICGSGLQYDSCCQLYHEGAHLPDTAESLMRSRFTAYAMKNTEYLLKTWTGKKKPVDIDFSKEQAEWTKLEILNTKKGKATDVKGIVEFKAYYIQDNEEYVMHEISRFQKVSGRWAYLDGLVKSVSKVGLSVNQGKNAPCACGSGKKFKRCCGK